MKFATRQHQALLNLLQQQANQGASTSHNFSHINQIGTLSSNNHSTIGNVLPFARAVSKHDQVIWILDSRATDHVTAFSHLFSSYKKIDPITVKLPTGHTVTATHAGRVQFSQFLYLEDVLYIPTFQFNLILISKFL